MARAAAGLRTRGWDIRYVCNAGLAPSLVGTGIEEDGSGLELISGRAGVDEVTVATAALVRRAFSGRLLHLCLTAVVAGGLLPRRARTVLSLTAPRVELFDLAGWQERLFWRAVRRAAVVDCLNPEMVAPVVSRGASSTRVRAGPGSFTDPHSFRPTAKECLVTFVGRLVEMKQPLLFVDAAALAARAVPEARFVMIGSGPLEGEVRRRVVEHGLTDVLTVVRTADVSGHVARSRVFASLQTLENYPSQSLLEAMAAENAIVATDVGRTAALVDGRTGTRVPAEARQVADAMVAYLRDRQASEAAGKAARKLVLSGYSIDSYLEYLRSVYLQAAASV